MFSKALVALTLATSALATVFVTQPVASTTFTAGQVAAINWQDDGSAPTLASFGPAKISIYAGNAQQQTLLQAINASVDVSTTSSVNFIPDATIGPNGSEYFIRFESISLKDATQPQYPALAFSAKFTLAGMTGTFSAAVLSQIAGQSTAPLASATAASTVVVSTTASLTTSKAASSTKASSASASASATSKASSSSINVHAGWAGALLSALVGVTLF